MNKDVRGHSLAERIKQARLASGMSQSALARALGIKPQAVQHWENGSSCPKTDRIHEVASVLDVQISWLLMDRRQDTELAREPSPSDYGQLTSDEKLIIKLFRSMDESHKTTFAKIAGVMVIRK